jgi:hypothetical protein
LGWGKFLQRNLADFLKKSGSPPRPLSEAMQAVAKPHVAILLYCAKYSAQAQRGMTGGRDPILCGLSIPDLPFYAGVVEDV